MSLFTEQVVLRWPGEVTSTDRYGRTVRAPAREVTSPAWYEPRQSSEDLAAKEQYVEGYWLYLPLTAPVDFETVLLGADEYQLVGKPGRQPGGFVVEGYYTMALEKVTG